MTTAFDFGLRALDGGSLDLAGFAGRPLLIVNTASKCGFTPHYAGLQTLWRDFGRSGLVVIGAPSNDFGAQEPGCAADIATFCRDSYGITFPMTEKIHVRGVAAHPLFQWLAREGGFFAKPRWNFYKYLIGRDGRLVNWFSCFTEPSAPRVHRAIERAVMPLST
jgi:glutathione peroxidase